MCRYGEQVHRLMAAKECAPKLLACMALTSGWMMTIMEYLPDVTTWDDSADKPAAVLRDAVAYMHGASFVHGDLRGNNVLLQKSAGLLLKVTLHHFHDAAWYLGHPLCARLPCSGPCRLALWLSDCSSVAM